MIKNLSLILSLTALAAVLPVIASQGGQSATDSASSPRAVLSAEESKPISLQRRNPRYQLSEGDVLDLDFPYTPEFNQTVTVLPDGFISLRGVDSIHVQGQTIPELRSSVQQAYARVLHDPVITVALKVFEKPFFLVGGQVQHPGKFDLHGDTTVMQAVQIAGGFNDNAKHSQVLLFRRVSNDWVEVKKLNLKDLLRGKDLREDSHLRPGDMLFVPKSTVSKIKQFIPSTGMGIYYNPAGY